MRYVVWMLITAAVLGLLWFLINYCEVNMFPGFPMVFNVIRVIFVILVILLLIGKLLELGGYPVFKNDPSRPL